MSVLPRMLMLIGRLGGTVTYICAADGRVELAIDAPGHVAHRFGPQLDRIVEVTMIRQLGADEQIDVFRLASQPGQPPQAAENS
jgi:hypothetical protein